MAARWSSDSVLALAPDDSCRRAAVPLARPAPWAGAGAAGDLVWGQCAGSGTSVYQVVVDLSGPAFSCSCPSRKFPCKHALGLLLLWSAGTVGDAADPPGYARAWQDSRRDRQQRSAAAAAAAAGSGPSAAADRRPGAAAGPRDPAGAARRAAERAERVTAGLADLQEWLRDQVRVGLASAAPVTPGHARGGRASAPAELMAARMVDAQAPGVAGMLRGLPALAATGPADAWPARLLAEYGLLHLLARAHERVGQLPDGLAAVVRSRVGYPVSRADVLAGPGQPGRWRVLAVRDLTDGTVPGRRVWLREADRGQWALLLTFASPGGAWQDPDTALLRPGTELLAGLHYYPGQPPLRAVIGQRLAAADAAATTSAVPPAGGDVSGMLAQWAAALALDPWLTTWPVVLSGTPVPAGQALDAAGVTGWLLADQAGHAVPLAPRDTLWTLLAVSGGQPVTVAGEWHPDGLTALTTWHGGAAVPL
jgi:hypothetical protein